MISAIGEGSTSGFTLVELCFTLTIIGLIVGLSWPSLRSMTNSMKSRSEAVSYVHQLQVTHEYAVLSGIAQTVQTPTSSDTQSSAHEIMFLPDGTARPLHVAFGIHSNEPTLVDVDAAAHITLSPQR